MNTNIRLRIKKEIEVATDKKILKLKGSLIAESFTDIIHSDEKEDHYISYFTTHEKESAVALIRTFIEEYNLSDAVQLL